MKGQNMLEYRSIYRKNAYRNTIANNSRPFLRTFTNRCYIQTTFSWPIISCQCKFCTIFVSRLLGETERPSLTLQTREIEPSSIISYSPLLAACWLPCWNKALTDHVICSSLNRRSAIGCCSLLWKSALRIAAGLSTTGKFGLNCDTALLAVLWLLFLAAGTSWLCLPSYVVMTALGSLAALSTCFLTLHPWLVHL